MRGYPPGHGRPPAYGPPPGYGWGGPPPQPYGAPPQPYVPPPRAPRTRPEIPIGRPVTDEDEAWAVPAYVGMFVVGFVAPVVAYAAKGRTSGFVRFHAAQALNLFIATSVCNLVAFLLAYFFLTDMTGLLLVLAALAVEFFCIVKAAMGANRREWYRLPSLVAWPIIR